MPTIPANRKIFPKLYIGRTDGTTWVDVTDYLDSAYVDEPDVDSRISTLQFTLRNDRVLMPVWDESIVRDEAEVVGDESDVVADESDGAEALINLLFDVDNALRGDTFAPLDRQSSWNLVSESYAPLLWANREVVLRVAITSTPVQELGTTMIIGEAVGTGDSSETAFTLDHYPILAGSQTVYLDGVEQTEDTDYTFNADTGTIIFTSPPGVDVAVTADYTYYYTLFHGYLGDSISTSGPTVTCSCRDLAKRLQDYYIETVREYGSAGGTAAETVIQAILDDNLGVGEITLYTPVSPGFVITPYNVEYESVWDAIQQIADQIGWWLGYRWRESTGQFELTLMEPPRTKDAATADWAFTADDDLYANALDVTDRDIRNAVKLTYRDSTTGQRASVTAEDATSIAEYGRRAMQIEEADTSLIDTEAEAQDLADVALADLKDLTGTTRLDTPLLPGLRPMDGITVDDPRTSSTVDFYGLESVRHTLDFRGNRLRTEAVGSGKVIGAHTRWLKMQTRAGARKPIETGEIEPEAVDTDRIAPTVVTTEKIAFRGIDSYAVVNALETDVITTTSTSYTDTDLITSYLDLELGDKVLMFAKASVWCTQDVRSTDGRIRHETPSGDYYSGLETRFTSSRDSHVGQNVIMEIFEPTEAGQHRWIYQWKSTQTGGYNSGSGTRVLQAIVLRGGS